MDLSASDREAGSVFSAHARGHRRQRFDIACCNSVAGLCNDTGVPLGGWCHGRGRLTAGETFTNSPTQEANVANHDECVFGAFSKRISRNF